MRTLFALFAGVTLLGSAACNSMDAAATSPSAVPGASMSLEARSSEPTIAGVAVSNPNFSTLVTALQKAGLVGMFDGNVHYTVFAPTNAAFDAAAVALGVGGDGAGLVAALDVPTLTAVLSYHVTRGDRNATSVVSAGSLRMLDGNSTTITVGAVGAKIDAANIVATDIRASNGLIHVIDAVILPPSK